MGEVTQSQVAMSLLDRERKKTSELAARVSVLEELVGDLSLKVESLINSSKERPE